MNLKDRPITLGDVKLLVRELLGYVITDHQLKKDLMEWLQSKGLTVDDVRIQKGKSIRYNLPLEFVEYELELCRKRQEMEALSRELYGEFPFAKIHYGTLEELSKKFEKLPSHELYPWLKPQLKLQLNDEVLVLRHNLSLSTLAGDSVTHIIIGPLSNPLLYST